MFNLGTTVHDLVYTNFSSSSNENGFIDGSANPESLANIIKNGIIIYDSNTYINKYIEKPETSANKINKF